MSIERLVKWDKKSQDFFLGQDSSIILDVSIFYSCASQSREWFKELVNSLNSKGLSKEIKKVNMMIVDISYLYRHMISKFSIYSNHKVPTEKIFSKI
jgi:hypothetical protein